MSIKDIKLLQATVNDDGSYNAEADYENPPPPPPPPEPDPDAELKEFVDALAMPVGMLGQVVCAVARVEPLDANEIASLVTSSARVAVLYEVQINPKYMALATLGGTVATIVAARVKLPTKPRATGPESTDTPPDISEVQPEPGYVEPPGLPIEEPKQRKKAGNAKG